MKKFLAMLLSLTLVLGLAACGGGNQPSGGNAQNSGGSAGNDAGNSGSDSQPSGGGSDEITIALITNKIGRASCRERVCQYV